MARSAARMGRKIKQIRNPSEAMQEAEEVVRKFHGREPRGVIEFDEHEEYEDKLGVLGQLMELNILKDSGNSFVPIIFCRLAGNGKPTLELEDMIQLATNKDGRPIYFKSGNQELELDKLQKQGLATGAESKRGLVIVGPVLNVVYWADKSHLEGPKYQKKGAQYEHFFGENESDGEDGEMPMLVYDIGNKVMHLAGGSYSIKPEGIYL